MLGGLRNAIAHDWVAITCGCINARRNRKTSFCVTTSNVVGRSSRYKQHTALLGSKTTSACVLVAGRTAGRSTIKVSRRLAMAALVSRGNVISSVPQGRRLLHLVPGEPHAT